MQRILAVLIAGRIAKDPSDRSAVPAVQVPALEIASPSKSQNLKRLPRVKEYMSMPVCRNTLYGIFSTYLHCIMRNGGNASATQASVNKHGRPRCPGAAVSPATAPWSTSKTMRLAMLEMLAQGKYSKIRHTFLKDMNRHRRCNKRI